MSLTLVASACSSAKSTAPTTTIRVSIPTLSQTASAATSTTTVTLPFATALPTVAATTTVAAAQISTSATTTSTTKDYEVVGGIFTTKTAAQKQIDKLTAAKFAGFSIKAVGAKFAAVLPGLTNANATALAAKINKAGAATATTFHLTASSTVTPSATATTVPSSTTKDYEVVGGIFTTKTAAQSQIDKLTAAKFAGFSIKVVGAKFAAVLPGLTNAEATALAAKINKAGAATATTFHLTASSAVSATATASTTPSTTTTSTSSTNYEVVDGIYTTKAAAQAQIDKLTKATFTGFTIKPITGKFAVVLAGLTNADASALVTKIDAAKLGPSRVKAL